MRITLANRLKNFFKTVEGIYGEDMAYAMAMEERDIKDSLNKYSNYRFMGYDTTEIYKELIRNELLCNPNENTFVPITRALVKEGKYEECFELCEFNIKYKVALVKAFIRHSNVDYKKQYKNCTDREAKKGFKELYYYEPTELIETRAKIKARRGQ